MATMRRPKGWTIRDYIGFAAQAVFICWPIAFGMWMNVRSGSTPGQTPDWFTVASGTVVAVMGAASLHSFLHSLGKRHLAKALISLAAFLFFFACGLTAALKVATNGTATIRDQKSSQMVTAGDKRSLTEQQQAQRDNIKEPFRSRTVQRQKIQIGEWEIVPSIETKIQRYSEKGSGYLIHTDGCKLERMYLEAQDFCDGLGELTAKRDAAKLRDTLQSQIASKGDAAAPSSLDPFADLMATLLTWTGHEGFEGEGKEVDAKKVQIAIASDCQRGTTWVIAEQIGPSIMLFILQMIKSCFKVEEQPQPKKARTASVVKVSEPSPGMTVAPPAVCIYKSFAERRLERCEGAKEIKSGPKGPMFELWLEDCAVRGVNPGTYQLFGRRLKKYVDHKDGGRPAWVNVRIKDAEDRAPLRLAVVNG